MSIIIPANSAVSGGFEVANSLMFNNPSSAYLSKTFTASNRKTFTISTWLKRSNLGSNYGILGSGTNSSTDRDSLYFESNDYLYFDAKVSSSVVALFQTNRKFRDVGSFYHIVLAFDTTQSTDTNRMKLYVNGELETFSSVTYPNQNRDMNTNNTAHTIGSILGPVYYFDGYLSETVFIDGTALAPTSFGEFDEDSSIWKPIDVSGLTFGTNGFYLDFEDSSALGNDAAGSNNFTANNIAATDQGIDTCTNNFATWNASIANTDALTKGNTTITRSSSAWRGVFSTIGLPPTGKWYCEFKISSGDNLSDLRAGIADDISGGSVDLQNRGQVNQLGEQTNGISYTASNGNSSINASEASYGSAISTSNVLGMAVDMTNMKLYFSKDGVFQNSGDPTSGATGTGALAIPATLGTYFISVGVNTSAWNVNFGSPYYAISSGNADGNGYGNFEYAVPSGYFSLNTKNLAEYG